MGRGTLGVLYWCLLFIVDINGFLAAISSFIEVVDKDEFNYVHNNEIGSLHVSIDPSSLYMDLKV